MGYLFSVYALLLLLLLNAIVIMTALALQTDARFQKFTTPLAQSV
jgi:hypothetical protein